MHIFKRFLAVLVATTLLTTTLLTFQMHEAQATSLIKPGLYKKDNMSIVINGERLQLADPILNKNGHTLLPMRALYEALDAQVSWDKASLTARAVRHNTTINLTIGSTTALVNNQRISLTTPSIMYQNRTYIPLRFVTENFDGTVVYNHQQQSVTITTTQTPKPPSVVTEPYTLYLNNQRIMMEEPAIIRNGRNYIPAKYFYGYLENTAIQWLDSQTLEMQIEGLVFTFRNNQNNILVNQEPSHSSETPFFVGNDMYVPIHFIVNALGGNLRFMNDTKQIYVYLNRFMFNSEFLPKHEGSLNTPILVPEAKLTGERQLLVSDNPETLTSSVVPTPRATLSWHRVTTTKQLNDHRVFGWHVNQLGKKVNIGITIENTSETNSLTIPASTGMAKQSSNSWINYDIGLPIADAILNDRLQNKRSRGITIKPGETALIDEFELYPGYILGFLNDITIETDAPGQERNYIIRTVLSENASDLTTIKTEPVPVNRAAAHPRGAWPQSALETTLPEYRVGSPEQGYNLSNGRTDHLLTEGNSLATTNGAIGNPGHFGMTYRINVPLVNDSARTQTVRLKAAGRGGLYSGAIKVNGEIHLIPTLKPNQDYVELIDYPVGPGTDQIEIEVMHAGGAALPLALYIETL
ncbi:copper amine oxidase N-terminal domain-containing protein [Halalkalibacter nanhaiisediminis]|uniref:Copper amine oxidase-like protein n=1 Tax=Halalkalibacter nanhaiisediminis TaxID=688079 RepID=A0A562QSZ7_9BACI|nr:copper amine oxidase N-terminal domain-containing protein [Halalkalibacter nanhaiisediminis]TWI59835.1 copper amine oxidase-like protein [Halalkalibacter nanhaiisediminis]